MNPEIRKVADFCKEKIDLETQNIIYEFNYASIPLCVVDSVFSIGVKYESVTNVIHNVCWYFNLKKHHSNADTLPNESEQISVSEFKSLFKNLPFEEVASNIFKNRQRTSTKNGVLKVEAVLSFLDILIKFNAEYFSDVNGLFKNKEFENEIKKIPGQSSGISLKYFFMLAGNDNLIKPDRMIKRFLGNVLNREVKLEECQPLLVDVSNELNKMGFTKLTPKLLDNKIWAYQKKIKEKTGSIKYGC